MPEIPNQPFRDRLEASLLDLNSWEKSVKELSPNHVLISFIHTIPPGLNIDQELSILKVNDESHKGLVMLEQIFNIHEHKALQILREAVTTTGFETEEERPPQAPPY